MKTWCPHWIWSVGEYKGGKEKYTWFYYENGDGRGEVNHGNANGINFCAHCGTPRPKEPMKLAERIYYAFEYPRCVDWKNTCYQESWRKCAADALEAVFEVIDEFGGEQCLTDVGIIKQAIRERLG